MEPLQINQQMIEAWKQQCAEKNYAAFLMLALDNDTKPHYFATEYSKQYPKSWANLLRSIANEIDPPDKSVLTEITLKAELVLELQSKAEWVRRIPQALPKKNRLGEEFLWVDKDGYVFEVGADFQKAEELQTYPCKIYRTFPVRTRTDTKD